MQQPEYPRARDGKPAMVRTKTPGIYRRGSTYVVVWKHRGRQHKEAFRTYSEAREAKGRRAQRTERQPESRVTFEDYARDWIESYRGRTARSLSDRTRAAYRHAIETYAIPHFGRMRLADVQRSDVRALVAKLERELGKKGQAPAPGTVLKALAPVKALFATAVEDDLIRANPCEGVRVQARRSYDPSAEEPAKALTKAELARFLAEVPKDWLLLFELLAGTGLRISEALGLTWGDLAQANGRPVLRVRCQFVRGQVDDLKSRHSRRDLPLSPGLARALTVARPEDAGDRTLIFATRTGRHHGDGNIRRRVLLPAATRAGLPHLTGFHIFRHTYASRCLEAGTGLSVLQVSRLLGHANPAFTMRVYGHLLDDGLGQVDFLDDLDNAEDAKLRPVEEA